MKAISKFRYFSLCKEKRKKFKKKWQYKSFNYVWIKGYNDDYALRYRYYYGESSG